MPLKEILIKYVAKVKKEKAKQYDAIVRDSSLDPSKTQIVVAFTSLGSQYVVNHYKSFKQMTLLTEKN